MPKHAEIVSQLVQLSHLSSWGSRYITLDSLSCRFHSLLSQFLQVTYSTSGYTAHIGITGSKGHDGLLSKQPVHGNCAHQNVMNGAKFVQPTVPPTTTSLSPKCLEAEMGKTFSLTN